MKIKQVIIAVVASSLVLCFMAGSVAQAIDPTFLKPLVSSAETANTSYGRDGGWSVPLPNGKLFWLFGDTPRYDLKNGKWYLTGFVTGSTAGIGNYKPGQFPSTPFNELVLGKGATATAKPQHFLPNPKLYLPDGSGRPCTKAVGGPTTEAVRWPQGAALMPDKTNILISYIGVCTYRQVIYSQSTGFALYNWKTRKFSTPPTDVFPANKAGSTLPEGRNFLSPVIVSNQVTFYSWGKSIYSTTFPANLAALKKQASYNPQPIIGLTRSYAISVSPASSTQPHLTMYLLAGDQGQFRILTAAKPGGPWVEKSTGVLPGCANSPRPCFTVALHPELSKNSRILATYYLPDAGNGLGPKHPSAVDYYGHIVMSYLPD